MKNCVLILFLLLLGCAESRQTPSETLIVGLSDPPTTLDPRVATDANSMRICDLIFQGLVTLSNDLKTLPDAASSWTITPQSTIFEIKPDLKFHNGSKVTLEDIVKSFEEYKKSNSPFSTTLENVKRVYAIPPNKIIFETLKPDASLLSNLVPLKILPISEINRSDFGRNPVGSGFFSFQSWSTGDLLLKRAIDFEKSNIKTLQFRFIRDENTRYLKTVKGEIDLLINEIQEEKVSDLRKSGQVEIKITPGLNFNFVLLNLRDERLKRIEVRRALFSALDREPIIKFKFDNIGSVATSLLAPVNPYSFRDLKINKMPIEDAREIIKGLTDKNFSLKTSDQALNNGQIISNQFERNIGLKINYQNFEWTTYFSDVRAGRYQMAIMRWVGVHDPDLYREALSTKEFAPSGHNRGFYSNREFDETVESARFEMNQNKRQALYTKAQQIIARDMPILPLWYNANVSILNPRVRNFEPSTNGSFLPVIKVYKE